MIKPYKNRVVENGSLVQVYRNLHTGNFSIKCVHTNLVLAHGDNFMLSSVNLTVNESGRQRVLMTKQKNVHAYAIGYISLDSGSSILHDKEIYYNPYKQDSFTDKETGDKIIYKDYVHFKDNKMKY